MILLTLDINGDTKHVSVLQLVLEHPWDDFAFESVGFTWNMSHDYGGQVRMDGAGYVGLSWELFDNKPPVKIPFTLEYTDTTEAAAVEMFRGTFHRYIMSPKGVYYKPADFAWQQQLLDEAENYDGDIVPLSRMFGAINHATPVRLPNDAGYPVFHFAYMQGSLTPTFAAVEDNGSGKARFTATGHPFSTSDSVVIEGADTDYDGTHTVTRIDASTFDITSLAFTNTTTGHCHLVGENPKAVYDNGVPITKDVTDNGDGTFTLSATPAGEITISGLGSRTDLDEVCSWARTRLGVAAFANTNARSPSPAVNFYANQQQFLVSFLADLCSVKTHFFHIGQAADVFYLVAMENDNGSVEKRQIAGDFFEVQYQDLRSGAIASISAEWTTRAAVEELVGTTPRRYVKDTDQKQEVSIIETAGGTNTSIAENKLIDSGADFSTVEYGMTARNITDGLEATVAGVDSGTRLALSADIFTGTGKEYEVGWTFPYGRELTVTAYDTSKAGVRDDLKRIMQIALQEGCQVVMPLTAENLPVPGKKISWDELRLGVTASMWIRGHGFDVDFGPDANHVVVFGLGKMT